MASHTWLTLYQYYFFPFTISKAIENSSLHAPLGVLGKGHGHYVPQSFFGGSALKHSLDLPGLWVSPEWDGRQLLDRLEWKSLWPSDLNYYRK